MCEATQPGMQRIMCFPIQQIIGYEFNDCASPTHLMIIPGRKLSAKLIGFTSTEVHIKSVTREIQLYQVLKSAIA